jgi:threonine synthase
MSLFELRCIKCREHQSATIARLNCVKCNGLLEISYYQDVSKVAPRLPLNLPSSQLTLGEGNSPAVHFKVLGEELGLEVLWAKLEYLSPTGSFKDRGSSVLISAAREEGVVEFVEDSSGNAGASLSAFAAAAGMTAHIFVPATTSENKLNQIRVYGATLHTIEGPRQAATESAQAMVDQEDILYLSHNYSAYFAEGMKSFSYEVTAIVGTDIEHIVFPVGNGSLLVGAHKGFDELVKANVLGITPKLHAVQALAISPIVAAINKKVWSWNPSERTVASGISVSNPPRIEQTVNAIRASGGAATSVADKDILRWQHEIATKEGVFCEPTSAAAFAGLEKLIKQGVIPKGSKVLVPVTGSGLKEPAAL